MAKLVLITARGVKLIDLSGPRLTIGRSSKCDLVIDRPLLSRIHAALSAVEGGGFSVCDLDSRNGTFVNGERIHRHLLRHHDTIRIGDCELRYLDAPVKSRPGVLGLVG
ncbi:Glycogen accumulation regulator GarA [Variovorax sp. SRS16]|uniref:FHA domain-containing protein n=1 Tax=Variovorax sp. SRS16 TaxID=282217 RepID=UPI0013189EB0|nr:FHA domain-containing protein [Variovorax sp. SRS16]VTU29041.1 Glycogen accumulation regulator GarA [Variovorax sp. SRS16]